jgi:hypothetical protein
VAVIDPVFVKKVFDAAIAHEGRPLAVTWGGAPSLTPLAGDHVRVRWETLSEINTYKFYVERKSEAWETVDSADGGGNLLSERQYAVTDSGAAAGTLRYRIREVDLNGSVGYSQTASITLEPPVFPGAYVLEQN